MVKKYLKTGTSLIGATVMVGAIPSITGSSTEAGLKSNFATGMGNVGSMLPAYGSVTGAKMVMKPLKKLKSSSSKLVKGGYKL